MYFSLFWNFVFAKLGDFRFTGFADGDGGGGGEGFELGG